MLTHFHRLTAEEAFATLRSGREGLTEAEAQRRLREYGPNRLENVERGSHLLALFREFTAFFSIILWIAAALAFLLDRAAPGEGMARLGYAIVAVIVVSGVFSFWQEYRAERTLAALARLLPTQVRVLRARNVREIGADALVPGDVVLLSEGDNVPADCRVVESHGGRVNMAMLTGESVPQPCDAAPSADEDPTSARNLLLAGTTCVAGRAKAVVFATGMHTQFGAITALTRESGKAVSPLRQQIAHASRVIMGLALVVAALFLAVGWSMGMPLWAGLIFAIGIIVAMVPEGLMPTLTLALALASQRMAARKVLIRNLAAVEALGATTVICTDKTGTLTQNRMTVKALFLGTAVEAKEAIVREPAVAAAYQPLFLAAAHCHDVSEGERSGKRTLLGDPMEIALVELARSALRVPVEWRRTHEIPFSAQRMRLVTVHDTPRGPMLYCKGAPETVLPLCTRVLSEGSPCALSATERESIERAHADMAGRGLRVLAFAYRPASEAMSDRELEQELIFCGLAGLQDPPRPEVPEAIRRCREAGIKVIMITGDHPATAHAIAREIGLIESDRARVVNGDELRRLSAIQLQLALDDREIIFARAGPDQKLRIVEALKRKGEIVAVTGDGVNDAPALKSAHIGIAMGTGGTDVARAAADVVLLDDNFATLVDGVKEGRAVFENIRKFLTYILAHNVPELVPYLAYALLPVPLALTPIQILAIDMGTDSLTALGLGVEQADPRVMQRPPRSPDERLLDRGVAARAYLFLGLIESVAAMSVFFFVLWNTGWTFGAPLAAGSATYMQATTACLIMIVVMQAVNVFLCRSADRSVLATGMRGNTLILYGIVLGLALAAAITYLPVLSAFFGTAPVGIEAWLFTLPFALVLIALEELRKTVVRRRTRLVCRSKRVSASDEAGRASGPSRIDARAAAGAKDHGPNDQRRMRVSRTRSRSIA